MEPRNILNKMRKRYIHQRFWFANLPKSQKSYLLQTWFFGIFGIATFIFISVLASQLSGIWHFASIMGGAAALAFFWASSTLSYAFYLERRIKALEENNNG
jgi:hypothetical protein